MIHPSHCKYVGIGELRDDLYDFPDEIYFITEYVILTHNPCDIREGDSAVILRVDVERGSGMMGRVKNVELLSDRNETVVVENPHVDVMNPQDAVPFAWAIAGETGKKGVIIRGAGEHVNFVVFDTPPPMMKLRVVDTIPDGRLSMMVREALRLGLVDSPHIVQIEEALIDMIEIAENAEEDVDAIVFPCRMEVPEFIEGKKTWFADRDIPFESIVLIGCDISRKIVEERYSGRIVFRNICPLKRSGGTFIARCCRSENTGKRGNGYVVHWGAGMKDVVTALNEILK